MGKLNPFSMAFSIGGNTLSRTLSLLFEDNQVLQHVASIFSTRFVGGDEGAKIANAVDYRVGSVQLPKYYTEEVIASIKVVPAVTGESAQSLTGGDTAFDSFLLLDVSEKFTERYHITETFGDDFGIFFSGQQPSVFNFSGILINDAYRQWRTAFVTTYGALLRGSVNASQRIKVQILYDSIQIQGYIFDLNINSQSEFETETKFSFSVLATNYQDLSGLLHIIPTAQDKPLLHMNDIADSTASLLLSAGLDRTTAGIVSGLISDSIKTLASPGAQAALSLGAELASDLQKAIATGDPAGIIENAASIISSFGRNVPNGIDMITSLTSSVISGRYDKVVHDVFSVLDQAGVPLPGAISMNSLLSAIPDPSSILPISEISNIFVGAGAAVLSKIPGVKALNAIARSFQGGRRKNIHTYYADVTAVIGVVKDNPETLVAASDSIVSDVASATNGATAAAAGNLAFVASNADALKGAVGDISAGASFDKTREFVTAAQNTVNAGAISFA